MDFFSGFRMNFFFFPKWMLNSRYYDDYYYRDRAPAYYGREDPYRDPYYAQNRNWYYQPEYRNPYDRWKELNF